MAGVPLKGAASTNSTAASAEREGGGEDKAAMEVDQSFSDATVAATVAAAAATSVGSVAGEGDFPGAEGGGDG